jgi:hypothetical protein
MDLKQFLPGSEGVSRGEGGSWVVRAGAGGRGEKLTQTLYVHMNKIKKLKNIN